MYIRGYREFKILYQEPCKIITDCIEICKKCELENSKHRIRQVCLPEMPCNRMHPPFCLYNFYNPYIEKKQPLLFLLLNIEKHPATAECLILPLPRS